MVGRIYAKKVVYDGIRFDSEMECQYYKELKEMESQGLVYNIQVHPSYVLQDAFTNSCFKKQNAITYEPDFVFFDIIADRTRYVDVKGMLLPEFELKWKMFDKYLLQENAYLEVLKYSQTTGWVSIEKYKDIMKQKKAEKKAKSKALEKEHTKLLAKLEKERKEKLRLLELDAKSKNSTLTKQQQNRYNELKKKYKIL